jgi:hypothetical protein
MRPKQELDLTENPTVYQRLYKRLRANCAWCKWHRIENATSQPRHGHRKLNKTRRGR